MAKKSYKEQRVEYKAQILKLLEDLRNAQVRIEAIKLQMPEVDAKERRAMKEERNRLLAEIENLPDDIAEAGRLYASADLGCMSELLAELDVAVAKAEEEVEKCDRKAEVQSRAVQALNSEYIKNAQEVEHDGEASAKVLAEYHAECKRIGEEWRPIKDAITKSQIALNKVKTQREALITRVMNAYNVRDRKISLENLVNSGSWPLLARNFGEMIKSMPAIHVKSIMDTEK